jgi:hypothetical protein
MNSEPSSDRVVQLSRFLGSFWKAQSNELAVARVRIIGKNRSKIIGDSRRVEANSR